MRLVRAMAHNIKHPSAYRTPIPRPLGEGDLTSFGSLALNLKLTMSEFQHPTLHQGSVSTCMKVNILNARLIEMCSALVSCVPCLDVVPRQIAQWHTHVTTSERGASWILQTSLRAMLVSTPFSTEAVKRPKTTCWNVTRDEPALGPGIPAPHASHDVADDLYQGLVFAPPR